jgi:hypothetical protein
MRPLSFANMPSQFVLALAIGCGAGDAPLPPGRAGSVGSVPEAALRPALAERQERARQVTAVSQGVWREPAAAPERRVRRGAPQAQALAAAVDRPATEVLALAVPAQAARAAVQAARSMRRPGSMLLVARVVQKEATLRTARAVLRLRRRALAVRR